MAGYRLYGWRQTGSMAVEAALGEIGAPFELIPVDLHGDADLRDTYRKINPRQQVPTLVLPEGTVLTEGPAILAALGDRHPDSGLVPAAGTVERALHDRWMAFTHANIYEGMLRELYADRYTDDPATAPAVSRAATAYVRRHFGILEEAAARDGAFLGASFRMIDIYLWMLSYWIDADWLAQACPTLAAQARTANARPALASVAARHFG